jgi:hypothetical protein
MDQLRKKIQNLKTPLLQVMKFHHFAVRHILENLDAGTLSKILTQRHQLLIKAN